MVDFLVTFILGVVLSLRKVVNICSENFNKKLIK